MVSIFTPTYNRAYILPQLYNSLKKQTCKNFEWIIVDDGSDDNTESLVSNWITEANGFPILYTRQENGGKHTAINKGVYMANYEWFFIVDSDDYLLNDAIEKVVIWINMGIDDRFAAISGTRCTKDMDIIGGHIKFDSEYLDCKNNERSTYGLGGDKAEIYKTSILKNNPFPVFSGETFISECCVWDKIALDGYLIRWFNSPIIVCDYLPDGLTSKVGILELKNFEGYTYATNIRLKAYHGLEHYRILCQYINKASHKGLNSKQVAKRLRKNLFFIWILNIVVLLKNKLLGDNILLGK